jgi:tetratricopeptide (TPR) repeat protein
MFGLGRAQVAVLDRFEMEEGVNNLRRAFDYYAEAGDLDQVVAVGSYPLSGAGARLVHDARLIPRALALVPPNSLAAGNLLYRHGWELGRIEGNYDAAQNAFNQALSIADQENNRSLEMWTRAYLTLVNFHHRVQEAIENGPRAIELAQQLNEPQAEVLASYYTAISLIELGEFDEARHHASRTLAVSERLRDRSWLTSATFPNQLLCHATGDFKAAIELNDQGLALSPMDLRHLSHRALLEYETGNFSQGDIYLDRLVETSPLVTTGPGSAAEIAAFTIPVVARISGVLHRLAVAQDAATTVLSTPSANPRAVQSARCGLSFLAVARGDATDAREQYAALKFQRGIVSFGALTIERVLGLLSHTMGNLDQAAVHFEDSLSFCRKAGYRPELAWTCCDYADTLLQRGEPGDREKAMSLLDESLAISNELGMRPLLGRVLSRREILKA